MCNNNNKSLIEVIWNDKLAVVQMKVLPCGMHLSLGCPH